MSIKKGVGKAVARCKLFGAAINQNNMFAVVERYVPAYYYLLYDEDKILQFHEEAIRQVREILKDNSYE